MTYRTKPPLEVRRALGKNIRAARKRRGWSMDSCASRVGTSRQQWIRWEKGENVPGDGYAAKIGELLGLDRSVFPAEDDDEEEAAGMAMADDLAVVLRRFVAAEVTRVRERASA